MGTRTNQTTDTSTSDTGEQQLITVDRPCPVEHFVSQSIGRQASEATDQSARYDTAAVRVHVVGTIRMFVATVFMTIVWCISR